MSDNYAELVEVMRAYVDDSDWSRGRDWCEKSVAAIEALVKERDALRNALKQIWFCEHNEREWASVLEIKEFAKAAYNAAIAKEPT